MSITGEAAGSQHGTSSSSGTDLEKCANCVEEPYSDAALFCCVCGGGIYLCTSCDVSIHTNRTFRLHKRISIVERRKELGVLKIHDLMRSKRSKGPIKTGQVEEDAKNKFCYFCPNERRIIFLPRLTALVKDPKARPSLVSFIGPTGVGKSCLLNYLLLMEGVNDAMDMPVIGAPADHQSTSADIHIYAHPGRQDSAQPLLYLDSEGRGGSKKPHGVRHLLDAVMRGPTNTGDEKGYVDDRYAHVQTSYPRMLYIFSDILCFVFSGNWREKSTILKPLLDWGETASRGADNQHRPQLIIIFNKTDEATFDDDFDDYEKTFRTWISDVDEQDTERLELYYSKNPLVVFVPHVGFDNAGKKVYSRLAKLRDAIMESTQRIRSERSEGKLLFTRRQLELYMRKVAGVFSKEPNGVFDIYKAMVADSAIVGLTGYIVKFRREVEIASRDDSTSSQKFVTSLKVLSSHVKQSMLLWISRNVDLKAVLSPKLPPDLRKALKDAKEIIENEMPCGAGKSIGNNFVCGTLKGKHKDSHSGVRTVMSAVSTGARYLGDFQAYPEVEKAMETYGNLVEVAENVFKSVSRKGVTYIREMVLGYRRSAREEYPWLKDFTSYQVCVICLLNLPTEMLSCGHIICDKCAKEAETSPYTQTRLAKPISMLCPVCQSHAKWYPTNLSPLAGCRILSLDGGGVRGIVELLSLEAIMAYFSGMHVEDLFDIVIGTSTGGIIALALTVHKPDHEPKRLPSVIDLFKHLAGEVFSSEQQRIFASFPYLGKFLLHMWYQSKYKNDALLRLLKQHLGEQSLLQSCVGGPRVIITACDYDKEAAAAWFTSYNRPWSDSDEAETVLLQEEAHREDNSSSDSKVENGDTAPSNSEAENRDTAPSVSDEAENKSQKATLRKDITKSSSDLVDGRVCDGYLFNAMEVAAATSAAPTFLPLVRAGDRRWVDGGLRYNGPPMIAINEAKKLWPERQVSALISLGCGISKKGSGISKKGSGDTTYGVLNFLKLVVDIALNAEDKCNSAISFLKELQPVYASTSGPGIRLNPTIDPCDLDDAAEMKQLIWQTEDYLMSTVGKAVVRKAANLLFAALFHLHIESDEDLHAQDLKNLRIRSCSALPPHLQVALKNSSDKVFSVTVETSGATPTWKFDWVKCTLDEEYMDLPFSLSGLPTHRPLKMVVKLHMWLPGTEKPEQYFPIPISGMPYILKAD